MRLRIALGTVLIAALMTGFTIAPTANAAPPATTGITLPLQGVLCTDATGTPVTCTVTAELQRFVAVGDQLYAQVLVTVTRAGQTASQTLLLPLQATGTCRILHLEIGPIDLNLLGLRIQTNRIVLDITAERGPGNLLGNLLCGIAGLLDSNAPATTVANLLNQLLALLR